MVNVVRIAAESHDTGLDTMQRGKMPGKTQLPTQTYASCYYASHKCKIEF